MVAARLVRASSSAHLIFIYLFFYLIGTGFSGLRATEGGGGGLEMMRLT